MSARIALCLSPDTWPDRARALAHALRDVGLEVVEPCGSPVASRDLDALERDVAAIAESSLDAALAGVFELDPGPAIDMPLGALPDALHDTLGLSFHVARVLQPRLKSPGGTLVVLCGSGAWSGSAGAALTGAVHAGLDNLVKTLATEWAPLGVRVVGLAAGPLARGEAEGPARDVEAARHLPAGRLTRCDDLAAAVRALLAPGLDVLPGATITVDGGASIRGLGLF